MKQLFDLFDPYNLRARVFPALLVVLPIALAFVSIFPVHYQGLVGAVTGCVALIGIWLLADHARDAGQNIQAHLYKKWGGKPSITILGHSQKIVSTEALARCHKKLRELDSSLNIPMNLEDEAAHGEKALETYKSCNELLLQHTRDKSKFSLLFEENIRYGFRRNAYAMRIVGFWLSVVGFVICGAALAVKGYQSGSIDVVSLVGAVFCICLVLFWALTSEKWVWRQANQFASTLILESHRIDNRIPSSKEEEKHE
ncbi:MAG TPA: hypothetical protein PK671_21655 [Candidatus Obscuribacter sp.]|nr:hypothetical protein [Candidatus Obscuribacter sp.]